MQVVGAVDQLIMQELPRYIPDLAHVAAGGRSDMMCAIYPGKVCGGGGPDLGPPFSRGPIPSRPPPLRKNFSTIPLLSDSMCANFAQGPTSLHTTPHSLKHHDSVPFRAPASPSTLTTLPMTAAV